MAAVSRMNWSQSSSSTGTTSAQSNIYLNQVMTIDEKDVIFTQDDSKYYFEITAKATANASSENWTMNRHPMPLLFKSANFGSGMIIEETKKAPYSLCTNGQFYTTSYVVIKGTTIINKGTRYKLVGGGYVDESPTNEESGDKYFIPLGFRPGVMKFNENFKYAAKYPIVGTNNGTGVELIEDNSSSGFEHIDDIYKYIARLNVKISIEKEYINNYRYLCIAEAFVQISAKSEHDLSASYEGDSYCSDTMDLKEYINCAHTWKYEVKDTTNHKMVCDKCKWEKDESHDYKYEYDGIKNNLCFCGFNKNVNHYFVYDSDNVEDKVVKLLASSSCTTYANPTKTGYVFKNYEQYYKYFNNMTNPVFSTTATKLTETKKGTITTLPTMSDRFSQKFVAKYDPLKYNVVFKANSNLGFNVSLTGISNLTNISYDTEYAVPTVSYTGHVFKGWSLTSGSSTVNIKTTDKIKNLTTTNAKTINVYPVFEKNKYTFKFATQSNISKINITKNIADKTFEYGTKYNLPNNIEVTGYIFNGWTKTKGSKGIDFVKNAEIYNYTATNNQSITLYPVYEPIRYSVIYNEESNFEFKIDLAEINDLKNIEYDKSYDVQIVAFKGYTFKGWSYTKGSDNADLKIENKIKNLTTSNGKTFNVYPVFEKNKYIFKYATESNVDKIKITEEINDLVCEYDKKYNLSNNVKVIGYNFIGWSLTKGSDRIDLNSNAEIFNYTDERSKIVNIYPVYEPIKYIFKFSNENKRNLIINGSVDNEEYVYDDVPKKLNKNIDVKGYKFVGWSKDMTSDKIDFAEEQEVSNYTDIDKKVINLYPVYTPMKYIFKFSEDNNVKKIIKNRLSDLQCVIDKKYKLPDNIDIEGYNFIGWTLTKESSEIDFKPNAEIYNFKIDSIYDNMEIDLYPVYEPIKYLFKFSNENADGITINGYVEDEEFIYDDKEKELNDAVYVRGYSFLGWSMDESKNEVEFNPRQKIYNYTSIDNKEYVLYPVYEPLKINIVYNTGLGNFSEGNNIATISYIVNDMNDFDYPTVRPNRKYNRWGELYKSDYLEFTGYKCGDKVFYDFNEFKEYILDRNVQNDIIILMYDGEVKTRDYKTPHSNYDDSDDDYVDFNKGPLKPSSKEIVYNISELESETYDNILSYMYVNESTENIYETDFTSVIDVASITYALSDIDESNETRKKDDNKENEVEEEEVDVDIEDEDAEEKENAEDDNGEIIASLSVADKWEKSNDAENINKKKMLLMIVRENKIQFIGVSAFLLIMLIAYEIAIYKSYRNRKKV